MRRVTGNYVYDVSNPDLVVAFRDYVLVGRIERYVGTQYTDSPPYHCTNFEVTILEVIKGNLEAGQVIPIAKNGGISEDKTHVILNGESDFLPEVGGVYIFIISVCEDKKTLAVYDGYDVVPLEHDITTELNKIEKSRKRNKQELISKCLAKSEVFARYVAAAENKNAVEGFSPLIRKIVQDKERYKSVYEK